MGNILPLAVTMGDPAGVGGELSLKAWQQLHESGPVFFCLDDPERLQSLSESLSLGIEIVEISSPADAGKHFQHKLPVLPVPLAEKAVCGQLNSRNGQAVLTSIQKAVSYTRSGQAAGVVTNPIHKAALYEAGFKYPGHTEYLAALAEQDNPSIMMLACPQLRVIPVTIHQSLKSAIEDLDAEKIIYTAQTAYKALTEQFGIASPRLAISGLNPHAGENGKMGLEDQEIVLPAIHQLQEQGINAFGPLPADTMFHAQAREKYDVAICMYHDQALIPIKTLDFHGGVNVTLGLPFIRTSPDHGTALDIAGKGIAEASSFLNALKFANEMASRQSQKYQEHNR